MVSDWQNVISDVPQGWVLVLTLFLIFLMFLSLSFFLFFLSETRFGLWTKHHHHHHQCTPPHIR